MYLLIACAGSWLVLLGSLFTAWELLPQPRTTSDIVVLVIIGAGVMLFARIGLISLLALLLRVLPSSRFRSTLAEMVVKAMPRILASSVLAVLSAGLVVHSAQAAPVEDFGTDPISSSQAPSAPADPGWPMIDDERSADSPDTAERSEDADSPEASESPGRGRPPDPGWPTQPPSGDAPAPPPDDQHPDESEESDRADDPDRSSRSNRSGDSDDAADPAGYGAATHIVAQGESLWSIAADLADTSAEVPQLVADVYATNEDTIGPDPSLILAGQRLEIQK
ncbi:hypothetical protein SAMN04489752_2745 [Brevibacterium siliguriense]|uniref:LysM domain-containing protein n=1 Tax=Brevibacterium siliguriense TaxID=1136497 RepID=A0A1H1VSV3_9MICO|nr:LysM domain-containing protein [Brevibacterium siliguriense]SDS87745.1 hypothetical protein SAMN04489752_2745 [Brevibacterium siliguriense]